MMDTAKIDDVLSHVERELDRPVGERHCGASDEELRQTRAQLLDIRAWIAAGGSETVPHDPRSIARRVTDTWSLTSDLTRDIVELMRSLDK